MCKVCVCAKFRVKVKVKKRSRSSTRKVIPQMVGWVAKVLILEISLKLINFDQNYPYVITANLWEFFVAAV